MIEWILVVWLISCGPESCVPAPAFPVGTYRNLEGAHGCNEAGASIKVESESVSFVALCVERPK